jgi:hypothetical protein
MKDYAKAKNKIIIKKIIFVLKEIKKFRREKASFSCYRELR